MWPSSLPQNWWNKNRGFRACGFMPQANITNITDANDTNVTTSTTTTTVNNETAARPSVRVRSSVLVRFASKSMRFRRSKRPSHCRYLGKADFVSSCSC